MEDGYLSGADSITITVLNVNDPPACDLARAEPTTLWPPNHKMLPLEIVNVTDPNNDTVTIVINGVSQDEPIDGLGDGDTSPDAALLSDGSLTLRAERAGTGNGRVYRIQFTADDGVGGVCTGSVEVCVPHRAKGACTDDGQTYYDSGGL